MSKQQSFEAQIRRERNRVLWQLGFYLAAVLGCCALASWLAVVTF